MPVDLGAGTVVAVEPGETGDTMEATFVFVLFLGFLLGGLMLILYMGYLSTEEARAQQERQHSVKTVRAREIAAEIPGFFAPLDAARKPATPLAFDDALLARLESHVRAEQAIVTQFVRYPSIDSLYRQGGQELRVH